MIFIILILALILRLINLNQSFWLDEAAQVIESARPFIQQFDIRADFWPPLYHLLLHFWMFFGKSEIWLRIPSIFFSLGTILILYLLAKNFVKPKWALFSAFLLASSQFSIYYAQEVRPYSLSALFGLLTVFFLIKEKYICYIIAVILFIYSSYLAPFMLLTEGVYIYIFNNSWCKKWIIAMAVGLVTFLPWLPEFFQQLNIGRGVILSLPGWSEAVSTPLIKALPMVFIKFFIGRITFDNKTLYAGIILTLLLLVLWLCVTAFKSKQKGSFVKLTLLTLLPIMLAFGVTVVIPVLAPQRVLFVLPLFYLLLTVGLSSVKNNIYRYIVVCGILLITLYSLIQYWINPRFQREQWRAAVSFVENIRTSKSSAFFVFPDAFAPWQWYNHKVVKAYGIAPGFIVRDHDLSNITPIIEYTDRIFYFHYLTDLTDPEHKTETYFYKLGFMEKSKTDFPGVGFISIYEKAMASL